MNHFCPWQQFTVYNDAISSVLGVDFGVAQGSIVGSLIFIVFMNDIINSCSLPKFIMYADATIYFMSSSNLGELYNSMNEELILVNSRLKVNKLTLNSSKTHYIVFHRSRRKVSSMDTELMIEGVHSVTPATIT